MAEELRPLREPAALPSALYSAGSKVAKPTAEFSDLNDDLEHSMDRGPFPVTAQTPLSRTIIFPNGTSPMNSTLAFPIVAGYTKMFICSCFFFFFPLFHPSPSAFKWVAEVGHGKAGSRNSHLCFVPKVPGSIEREAAWAEIEQKQDF